jgi:hypothetical protein
MSARFTLQGYLGCSRNWLLTGNLKFYHLIHETHSLNHSQSQFIAVHIYKSYLYNRPVHFSTIPRHLHISQLVSFHQVYRPKRCIGSTFIILSAHHRIMTWRLKAGIAGPDKSSTARKRPVNTFPQQPKHAPASTIPGPSLGNSPLNA